MFFFFYFALLREVRAYFSALADSCCVGTAVSYSSIYTHRNMCEIFVDCPFCVQKRSWNPILTLYWVLLKSFFVFVFAKKKQQQINNLMQSTCASVDVLYVQFYVYFCNGEQPNGLRFERWKFPMHFKIHSAFASKFFQSSPRPSLSYILSLLSFRFCITISAHEKWMHDIWYDWLLLCNENNSIYLPI